MFRKIIVLLFVIGSISAKAQELNATVQVLAPTLQMSNAELLPSMQKAIENLLNYTSWTNETYEIEERIRCSFVVTINSRNNNNYSASLQINYSRPIYKASYDSPVLNYKDNDFNFTYLESMPLEYVQNSFTSNLTAVIAFYSNIIIGLDKDTYAFKAGETHYQVAQSIVNIAQGEGGKGWKSFDGSKNRFWMIDNLLNSGYVDMRYCLYNYHRLGLDLMYNKEAQREAKEKISASLIALRSIYEKRPNAFILQLFFDAKSNEIVSVFKDGPNVDTSTLIATLKKIDAGRASKYESISR